MGPVGGTESVVDIDVTQAGQLFGKGFVAFFFFFVKP